jgi:NAD(P)-dependent dehydrogenase (short-subunit alcohol dehydrogenase family)
MGSLQNKIAIVTGAASGIGAETVGALAREGAKVIVADINVDGAHRRADALKREGHEASAVRTDIGEESSVRELIRFAVNTYGALDVLCNNAANTQLSSTRDVGVEHTETEVWDAIMHANLRGTMLACKYAIPQLRARGGGSIINISSGAALSGALAYTAYGVSKAGIITLTQYLATQHGKEGIRCNAIAPGLIVTPSTESTYAKGEVGEMMLRHHLTPRLGKPADIAAAVVYLASDQAAFLTGQVISVDGGLSAHTPFYADAYAARKT